MTLPDDKLRELIRLAEASEKKQGEDDYWYCPSALFAELDYIEDAYYVSACDPVTIKALVQELLSARAEIERLKSMEKKHPCDEWCDQCQETLKHYHD